MDVADRINVLPEAVARRIAAGEVIERPAGVVRELIDNSLDASASRIDVTLEAGGIDLISVRDNGLGMSPDDLSMSVLPHATSKIASLEDLQRVQTMGFRGEALASVAAVSRLEILSARDGFTAHRILVDGGRADEIAPTAASRGTTVSVSNLFYNVPARRQFLKRAASEASLARAVFADKAVPFPEVEFAMTSGQQPRTYLGAGSLVDRIAAVYPSRVEPSHLVELTVSGDGFTGTIIAGEPGFPRKDRKNIQVFVNRRRIWEYALVQAVEYAYRDYLHGGLYPTAFLFLEVEPSLVDFNIHPAKREARFRSLPEIHRRVVAELRDYLRAFNTRTLVQTADLAFAEPTRSYSVQPRDAVAAPATRPPEAIARIPHHPTPAAPRVPESTFDLSRTLGPPSDRGFRYLGQVMNLFLAVEVGDSLYLVDQHAAHERIIYDRLRQSGAGQELLFPVRIEATLSESGELERQRPVLEALGIRLERSGSAWELTAIPAAAGLDPETIAALLMEQLPQPDDFEAELYASLSCRAAVMDGDVLAPETAEMIISGVIGLDNARCPHGRPVWIEWQLDDLKRLVGRT